MSNRFADMSVHIGQTAVEHVNKILLQESHDIFFHLSSTRGCIDGLATATDEINWLFQGFSQKDKDSLILLRTRFLNAKTLESKASLGIQYLGDVLHYVRLYTVKDLLTPNRELVWMALSGCGSLITGLMARVILYVQRRCEKGFDRAAGKRLCIILKTLTQAVVEDFEKEEMSK